MIKEFYKGVYIELEEDGSSYDVYEFTPVFKTKKSVMCGASVRNYYTLDAIKEKIDLALTGERHNESNF